MTQSTRMHEESAAAALGKLISFVLAPQAFNDPKDLNSRASALFPWFTPDERVAFASALARRPIAQWLRAYAQLLVADQHLIALVQHGVEVIQAAGTEQPFGLVKCTPSAAANFGARFAVEVMALGRLGAELAVLARSTEFHEAFVGAATADEGIDAAATRTMLGHLNSASLSLKMLTKEIDEAVNLGFRHLREREASPRDGSNSRGEQGPS